MARKFAGPKSEDAQELFGFKLPEGCATYSLRLRPSIMDEADRLLDGASRSVLVDNLVEKWIKLIKARKAERLAREAFSASPSAGPVPGPERE